MASSPIESMSDQAIIGIATLSWSRDPTPPKPPRVMAASCPATWQATCTTLSQITGLTLPGMMEDPGWVAGRTSSPRPQRGPDPSQRMSFAILERLTAMVLSSPDASTTQSRVAWASKWFRASLKSILRRFESRSATAAPKSGWVLIPVPTAVPPIGRFSASRTIARPHRMIDSSTWAAKPENSWPTRMGVASCRCVRPVLTISSHRAAFRERPLWSFSSAGTSCVRIATAPATCMAVGKVSLLLCPWLTWSLGCTGSRLPSGFPAARQARLAITSFAFMLVLVPEPVW